MLNIKTYSYEENEHLFGPGRRLVVFCQGCSLHCKGCVNQHLWQFGVGRNISTEEIVALCDESEGITLHGGEPLDQSEGILEVIRAVKTAGKTVVLFTGYQRKELHEQSRIRAWYLADIVISGRYMEDKKNIYLQFRGSTNQRVICHSGKYKNYLIHDGKSVAIFRLNEHGSFVGRGFQDKELQDFVQELKKTNR